MAKDAVPILLWKNWYIGLFFLITNSNVHTHVEKRGLEAIGTDDEW